MISVAGRMVSQSLFEPMIRATFALINLLSSRESRVLYGNYCSEAESECKSQKMTIAAVSQAYC
jgi:hypothetical protein